MRILLSVLGFLSLSAPAFAECNLPRERANYETHSAESKRLIAIVEANVLRCLNQYKDKTKKMFEETRESLGSTTKIVSAGLKAYSSDLNTASLALLTASKVGTDQRKAIADVKAAREKISGSGDMMISVIGKMRAQLAPHGAALRKNEGDLTKYGFVRSDKKDGANFKYPECNSVTHFEPERTWVDFKANYFALEADLARLQQAVTCQLQETGAKLEAASR